MDWKAFGSTCNFKEPFGTDPYVYCTCRFAVIEFVKISVGIVVSIDFFCLKINVMEANVGIAFLVKAFLTFPMEVELHTTFSLK